MREVTEKNERKGKERKGKERKGKERKSIYIAPFYYTVHKALRHGSHSFTCKLHHACLSFVAFARGRDQYEVQ